MYLHFTCSNTKKVALLKNKNLIVVYCRTLHDKRKRLTLSKNVEILKTIFLLSWKIQHYRPSEWSLLQNHKSDSFSIINSRKSFIRAGSNIFSIFLLPSICLALFLFFFVFRKIKSYFRSANFFLNIKPSSVNWF